MAEGGGGEFAKKVVKRLRETAQERGKKVAEQWGSPLDGQAPTRQQALELWNYRRPESLTPEGEQYAAQLFAAGRAKDAVNFLFPWRMDRVEVDPATGAQQQYRGLIPRGDIKRQIDVAQKFAEQAMQSQLGGEVMA